MVLSDRVMISFLSVLFLIEMVEEFGVKRSGLSKQLEYYSHDVQQYFGISAQTGAINAVANLALFIAVGVDFPIIWCFFHFS